MDQQKLLRTLDQSEEHVRNALPDLPQGLTRDRLELVQRLVLYLQGSIQIAGVQQRRRVDVAAPAPASRQ